MIYDAEYYKKIRSMSIDELFTFKGRIIPWPPSDEDVAFKARLFDEFIKLGKKGMDQRHWSNIRGERFYGEYHFGIRMGLEGNCGVFEQGERLDYRTPIGRIDVKSIISRSHRLMRGVDDRDPADILVLALINPDSLSLNNVSLIGWCYDDEIIQAPIVNYRTPAYALYGSQLHEISVLISFQVSCLR